MLFSPVQRTQIKVDSRFRGNDGNFVLVVQRCSVAHGDRSSIRPSL